MALTLGWKLLGIYNIILPVILTPMMTAVVLFYFYKEKQQSLRLIYAPWLFSLYFSTSKLPEGKVPADISRATVKELVEYTERLCQNSEYWQEVEQNWQPSSPHQLEAMFQLNGLFYTKEGVQNTAILFQSFSPTFLRMKLKKIQRFQI
jgi:hypothetical protein